MLTRDENKTEIDQERSLYALQHLETREFICLLQEGTDYLACFSDGDTAFDFRTALGLQEHVDIAVTSMSSSPFTHFWLDGANVVVGEESAGVKELGRAA